jgi:hypothetical protein
MNMNQLALRHPFHSSRALTYPLILILLVVPVSGLVSTVHGSGAETYIILTPSTYVASEVGETFNVSVDVLNPASVVTCQFELVYDQSFLSVVRVVEGSLISPPPIGSFSYQVNAELGFIQVNASVSPESPVNEKGTVAIITFQITATPMSMDASSLTMVRSTLLDLQLTPIVHDVIGAVVFWQNVEPDPPVSGRILDLYTQKGGIGEGTPDGIFATGDLVTLGVSATFNDVPVQQKLVSFEVHNPLNDTVVLRSATTDSLGQASVSFRIPVDPSSIGEWTAIALVDIAGETAWDIVTFYVNELIPTGGYSTITAQNPEAPTLSPVLILVFAFALALLIFIQRHRLRTLPARIRTGLT